ncbi:KIN17 protein [Coccidioides immitis H538.4]|uniref:KIN17 protein n=1 Tax=Coccidioides immitis H538.4 TaxID=396776 RepID=A0A0J8RIF9_COCIT|nr:KIN17 protein [Coccidioides immitis H538.4]
MPRAEVGSTKFISNKLKSKGLQRLRWYCQVCQRQMRDENGFKCHTQSESHVRQMLLVGEDPKKYIQGYSNDFLRDFIQLLRTSHGEKQVHINHFYQEYIANKEHIHMNATKWSSLTEFAKYLGREGICRVEEGEKGIFISWIDNSPEALRRQDAIRKRERQDRGDEEREKKLIEDQIKRAQRDKDATGTTDGDAPEAPKKLQRVEGEKITLNFASKLTPQENSAFSSASEKPDQPKMDHVVVKQRNQKSLPQRRRQLQQLKRKRCQSNLDLEVQVQSRRTSLLRCPERLQLPKKPIYRLGH